MRAIVSDPDVTWWDLVIDSCFSKGLHSQMAKRSWLLHSEHKDIPSLDSLYSDKTINQEIDEYLDVADADIRKDFSREELLERSMAKRSTA